MEEEKMDNQSLVSVIIPIFNGEKYIENCMRSLQNQTFTNFEIILVNDGSTDKTEKICLYYQKKILSVKYYYQQNAGVGAARNLGLKCSTGKYVMFVDCDDYLYPTYIEELYKLVKENNVEIACCSYFKGSDADLKMFLNQRFVDGSKLLSREQMLESLFYRKEITGYPVCKLFSRDIIGSLSFELDIRYGEDFLFIYEMFKKSSKAAYTDKKLYFYWQHSDSVTHTLNYEDMKILWHKINNRLLVEMSRESKNLEQAVLSKLFILAIDYLIKMEDMKQYNIFRNKLIEYIDKKCDGIYKDIHCKCSNRILAISCKVNIKLTILCCYYCLKLCKKLGVQLRKVV